MTALVILDNEDFSQEIKIDNQISITGTLRKTYSVYMLDLSVLTFDNYLKFNELINEQKTAMERLSPFSITLSCLLYGI